MNIQTKFNTEDKRYWFGNTLISFHLESANGSDGLSVVEHLMPFGEAPPLHVHRNEDEVFHILDGLISFQIGGRALIGQAGDTLIAPKGIPHAFRVESLSGARCLTIMKGAEFETMLRETSRPAQRPGLPPSVVPTPDMVDTLVGACARNGIDIIGPPIA